jgi:hypothetical protein
VDEGRIALEGLDKVGLEGVAENRGHGPGGLDPGGGHGFAVGAVADHDPAQAGLQVGQVLGKTQDGHDLGGGGDVEAGLPGEVPERLVQADDDRPQGPIVHVQGPFPGHAAPVDRSRGAVEMDPVVDHGR